jgi:hypothetical protein
MDFTISNQDRIDLKRLLDTMECENNTEHIRKLKQTSKIRQDIMDLVKYKNSRQDATASHEVDPALEAAAAEVVPFLANCYPDIFKKVMRNELNYAIMNRLLNVLQGIEDEKVDQHEGSVLVGKILKELYLDSAVRHGENLDKMYASQTPPKEEPHEGQPISWKEYKTKTAL